MCVFVCILVYQGKAIRGITSTRALNKRLTTLNPNLRNSRKPPEAGEAKSQDFITTAKQAEMERLQPLQLLKKYKPAMNPGPPHRQISSCTQGAIAANQGGLEPALGGPEVISGLELLSSGKHYLMSCHQIPGHTGKVQFGTSSLQLKQRYRLLTN